MEWNSDLLDACLAEVMVDHSVGRMGLSLDELKDGSLVSRKAVWKVA
jgi:hypothetical protein